MPSCSEAADCPGLWECDKIAERCVRTEPSVFFWNYVIGALLAASASLIAIIVLTEKKIDKKE